MCNSFLGSNAKGVTQRDPCSKSISALPQGMCSVLRKSFPSRTWFIPSPNPPSLRRATLSSSQLSWRPEKGPRAVPLRQPSPLLRPPALRPLSLFLFLACSSFRREAIPSPGAFEGHRQHSRETSCGLYLPGSPRMFPTIVQLFLRLERGAPATN